MGQHLSRSFLKFLSEYGIIFAWLSPVIFLSLVAITIAYLSLIHANPPVEFNNLPFPTDKSVYVHGEYIRMYGDYCRNTDVPFIADLEFRDDIIYRLPPISGPGNDKGCFAEWSTMTVIPESLPPGHYHVWGKTTYRVNLLKTRVVSFYTEEFEVKHGEQE